MKKHIIILAAFIAAALLAPACYPEDTPGLKTEGITLSVFSDEPETKAYDPTFETAIDHFDFYFFKDEDGTEPLNLHGRATGSSTTLQTGKNQTYAALRKGGAFVYIIANYPGDHPTTTNMTLQELLALEVNYPILTGREKKANAITGDMEETGKVTFNNTMVMDSYHKDGNTEKYTVKIPAPTAVNQAGTVDVGLSRLAAKLKMVINVASSVTGSLGSEETWTPVMSDLKAYYVNALNNKTTVGATPIQRPVDTTGYGYITYPTAYPVTVSGNTGTTDPAFTYPQEWDESANGDPYFKIQMTWSSNLRGTSPFYYKVRVPRAAADGKCTLKRNTFYTVTVDLSVVDTDSDYVELTGSYIVTPWAEGLEPGGSGLAAARFFNVPVQEFTLYSDASVAVPYYSSSVVSAYFTKISFKYYGDTNGTLHTYTWNYSETDNKTSFTLPTTDTGGQTVDTKARDANTYKLTVNNSSVSFSHPLDNVYTMREVEFVIKNADNKMATVKVTQHPAIEVKTHITKNGFVNGRFARGSETIKDADGNKIGVGPYDATHFGGGSFYHSSQYWTTNGSNPRIGYDAAEADGLGIIYGDCTTSVSAKTMFITEVTVSAFSEGSNYYTVTYSGESSPRKPNYIIGDPRVKASTVFGEDFTLPNYLYSDRNHRSGTTATEDVFEEWEKPMDILIANQGVAANEVIAPRFLVSSNMNNMSNWSLTHDAAVKRAMTYQEAGYPAGRWRLPTEAEIAFMMSMQQKGVIPQLYAFGTTNYHCANGRRMQVATGGTITSNSSTATSTGYLRFVYDLWYWGDDPMDPDVYHPNMHEHTNN
ncbi:MAG: hypothetical protein IJU08_06330 [Bacteroidales bacterium]|nr:hypothetical protein [Bacteroidales bacterium]